MSTTMENIKDMIDVNVVVGDAVETGDGSTIIPISRVSFGFVAGGGEYAVTGSNTNDQKMPFAGGAGTGVSVNPMGFLIVSNGQVKLLPAQYYAPIDRIIEMIPDLMGEIKNKLKNSCCQDKQAGIKTSGQPVPAESNESTTGMYITPQNVPCEVCAETDQGLRSE